MPDFWYEICRTEMFNPTWTGGWCGWGGFVELVGPRSRTF